MTDATKQPDEFIDLAKIDTKAGAEEGREMEIISPSGDPTGQFLMMLGEDAERYQERLRAVQRKSANRFLKRDRYSKGDDDTEEDSLGLLVLATTGWRRGERQGIVTLEGRDIPFTRDNVRDVYRKFPDIRDQASSFIRERANFLPKSATASSPSRNTSSD